MNITVPKTSIPRMVPIVSSNIDAVGYDAGKREMHIRFKTGSHYVYHDVSPEVHSGMYGAQSAGRYFSATIKDKFTTRRLA